MGRQLKKSLPNYKMELMTIKWKRYYLTTIIGINLTPLKIKVKLIINTISRNSEQELF